MNMIIASIYFYALIVFTCRYLEDNFNDLQAIVISYYIPNFRFPANILRVQSQQY